MRNALGFDYDLLDGGYFGPPMISYGEKAVGGYLSYGAYGIEIRSHYDFFGEVSNNTQIGDVSFGDWKYAGASVDVDTFITPWGWSQSYDIVSYKGWGSYVNAPGFNLSVSHGESQETQLSHSQNPWMVSDFMSQRTDSFDFANVQIGNSGWQSSMSTHTEMSDLNVATWFGNEHVHTTGSEFHLDQMSFGPNSSSSHHETFESHTSDVQVSGLLPFMLPQLDHSHGFLLG